MDQVTLGHRQVGAAHDRGVVPVDGQERRGGGVHLDPATGAVQYHAVVDLQVTIHHGVALEGAFLHSGVPCDHGRGVLGLHASAVGKHGAADDHQVRSALQVDAAVRVGGEGILRGGHAAVHLQADPVDVVPVKVVRGRDGDVVEDVQASAGRTGELTVGDDEVAPVLGVDAVLALTPEGAVRHHHVGVDLHDQSIVVPLDGGALEGDVGAGAHLDAVPVAAHPAVPEEGVPPDQPGTLVAVVGQCDAPQPHVGILGVHPVVRAVADGAVVDGNDGVVQDQSVKAVVDDRPFDVGVVGGDEEPQLGVAHGAGVTAPVDEGVGDEQAAPGEDDEMVGAGGRLGGDDGGVVCGGGKTVTVTDLQVPAALDLDTVVPVGAEIDLQGHVLARHEDAPATKRALRRECR